MSTFEIDDGGLRWEGVHAPEETILGFHERFDPWRGGAWLDVDGPGWSVPIDDGYRDLRRRLRAAFVDRPFTADWSLDGRFPGLLLGRPPARMWALTVAWALFVAYWSAILFDPWVTVGVAVLLTWALGSARVSGRIDPLGLRLGPSWTPRVPWHEVEEVGVEPRSDGAVRVVATTRSGLQEFVLPEVLVPAFRARLWRLGGVRLQDAPPPIDRMYLRWRAAGRGVPWGLVAVTLVGAALADRPFLALTWGLLLSTIAALVGAAVEARVSGWRQGGIVWMTGAWAVVWMGGLLIWLGFGP